MRAGPGLGYIYPSQGDYNQSVYGGGNGDYKVTVLAPSTVQECIDLTYKAFYYAQKYRNPTMILADGLLGQMMEPAQFGEYPYPEIDVSSWALTGAKGREGRKICSVAPSEDLQLRHIDNLFKKYQQMEDEITEWEEFETKDADIILVAFGSITRNVKAAMKALREEGLKVGVFRPVTLSPFPEKRLSELAEKCQKFVVVEMNMGQMVRDVKIAVNGKASVDLVNRSVGQWLSVEEITARVKEKVLEKTYASI